MLHFCIQSYSLPSYSVRISSIMHVLSSVLAFGIDGKSRIVFYTKTNKIYNFFFEFIEYHSTCFGRSFRPSSEVQDCTYSVRNMSYRFVDYLLAGTRWNSITCASKQSTNVYDIFLTLYVQSWIPDDGRKDRPKYVERYSINSEKKNCASSWFYYRNISRCTVP